MIWAECNNGNRTAQPPCLLNLKQCWGHEDGLLFIATNFLFKRALLLCFLSRFCRYRLTSSPAFPCTRWLKCVGIRCHDRLRTCTVLRDQGRLLFNGTSNKRGTLKRNDGKKKQNIPARELHRRSGVQPYASNEPIFLLGMTAMQSDALLSVTFHHHPDHLRPPTSLPPPTQGRSGREFLISSAPALHGTSAAYRTSAATSI